MAWGLLIAFALAGIASEAGVKGVVDAGGVGALFLGGGAIYFLPSIIARHRHHRQGPAIVLVNLLLGWTFLGWLLALVWAATDPGAQQHKATGGGAR
jgi:hypothetical protein